MDFLPYYTEFHDALIRFSETQLFHQYGIIFVFLYSLTPSFIPIPSEVFMITLIEHVSEPSKLSYTIFLIMLTTIGSIIADILILLGGRKIHKLFRISPKAEMKEQHAFHKYGLPFFLITPFASIILWGLNEALLAIAGHYRSRLKKTICFVIAGELIRGFVGGFLLLQILGTIF